MTRVQMYKQPMRAWLHQYSDERLAALQAHAQSGRLSYFCCCCFVGSLTATHPLTTDGNLRANYGYEHLAEARRRPGAEAAEASFALIATNDPARCRIVAAMCKAEFKRRDKERRPFQPGHSAPSRPPSHQSISQPVSSTEAQSAPALVLA